jgi:hypothetical protein
LRNVWLKLDVLVVCCCEGDSGLRWIKLHYIHLHRPQERCDTAQENLGEITKDVEVAHIACCAFTEGFQPQCGIC